MNSIQQQQQTIKDLNNFDLRTAKIYCLVFDGESEWEYNEEELREEINRIYENIAEYKGQKIEVACFYTVITTIQNGEEEEEVRNVCPECDYEGRVIVSKSRARELQKQELFECELCFKCEEGQEESEEEEEEIKNINTVD